jgi:SAM-dependent methyltransferase
MSICLQRLADVPTQDLEALEWAMTAFYNHPPDSYYEIADRVPPQYTEEFQPFHHDLVSRVSEGMKVLELGCGTAHLCPSIERRGGVYTGMDHSAELLEENRRKFPRARFHSISSEMGEMFDLVASLYTIEHVVDPPAYLERMWTHCKPGGFLAVICPEFIDNDSLPPSLFFGKTARRFKEKVRSLSLLDACSHLIDLKGNASHWKAQALRTPPGAFWINLRPRILYGADYSIDADAVHLPRLVDLAAWFQGRGAEIVTTSRNFPNVNPDVLRHNCYVLVRKSSAASNQLNRT